MPVHTTALSCGLGDLIANGHTTGTLRTCRGPIARTPVCKRAWALHAATLFPRCVWSAHVSRRVTSISELTSSRRQQYVLIRARTASN